MQMKTLLTEMVNANKWQLEGVEKIDDYYVLSEPTENTEISIGENITLSEVGTKKEAWFTICEVGNKKIGQFYKNHPTFSNEQNYLKPVP